MSSSPVQVLLRLQHTKLTCAGSATAQGSELSCREEVDSCRPLYGIGYMWLDKTCMCSCGVFKLHAFGHTHTIGHCRRAAELLAKWRLPTRTELQGEWLLIATVPVNCLTGLRDLNRSHEGMLRPYSVV